MLGLWPLTSEAERQALAFLIAHMPCDGRLEVEIRLCGQTNASTDCCAETSASTPCSMSAAAMVSTPGHSRPQESA